MKVRLVRDGKLQPDLLTADPVVGHLTIDDGTGFVSAATPTDEIVKASPVIAWTSNGSGITASVANGTLSPNRAGLYRVDAMIGRILGGNASVMAAKIFVNGADLATGATAGGGIEAATQMAAAATTESLFLSGTVSLASGDTVSLAVTGSVGTVTIKMLRFTLTQLSDATVATPT